MWARNEALLLSKVFEFRTSCRFGAIGSCSGFGQPLSRFTAYADVGTSEITFHFERADTNVAATKSAFEEELRHVKEWIAWVNNDVTSFRLSLESAIRQAVTERRRRVQSMDAGMGSLGIPRPRASSDESSKATSRTTTVGASTRRSAIALQLITDRSRVEPQLSTKPRHDPGG